MQAITKRRAAAGRAIVESQSPKRLIVAGPGTGKTFIFREALKTCDEEGLALTFIRNLVADLESALEGLAHVNTFHGYCHHLVRKQLIEGLDGGWTYYPQLVNLLAEDLALLGEADTSPKEIDRRFHTIDERDGVVDRVLELGTYYNAAGHNDVVLRELRHLEQVEDDIPAHPLVVVDEYQDFSLLETRVIERLASKSPVLIAGDDDQALYGFKGATPEHMRDLANGGEYEILDLPYCSRCTHVVVEAVNDMLKVAALESHLDGRLAKEFSCFLPDKQEASATYLKILHARCSVDRKGVCYPGRYIAGKVGEIPAADIEASHKGGYPTVLVIGPNPFLRSIAKDIAARLPQVQLPGSGKSDLDVLKGYELLADDQQSRLGWRIIVHAHPFSGSDELIADTLRSEGELARILPDDYRDHHLRLADLIRRLLAGEELSAGEVEELEAELGRSVDQLLIDLGKVEPEPDEIDPELPTIMCTTLLGSKGLSAEHVFIVGFVDGHLPRQPEAITDDEICSFVVGLSRTRKQCHLISADRAMGARFAASCFLDWIGRHVVSTYVDKAWLEATGY